MSKLTRKEYLSLRRRFEPQNVRLVIIAESPPASGLYFYNQEGRPSEPLFAAFMRQLGHTPLTKEDGLREFQRSGWVLIDAAYQPVNKLSATRRNRVIAQDYQQLRRDLENLITNRSTPLILVKSNVCRLLEPKLAEDRFHVLNRGSVVYFPSSGQQARFHHQFSAILKSAEI